MTTTIFPPELPASIDVSGYAPLVPPRHEPLQIAEDTYLIRSTFGEGHAPAFVYVNSMVITGKEPVIVDTGTVGNRESWLNDVFSFVDPKDVRWIFLSHDDHDHVGNVLEAMALCSDATLVTNWFQMERLTGDLNLPQDRMMWVDDGGSFIAGDRGLFDSKTGVYWAADSFGTPISVPIDDVSGMHPEEWRQGFSFFNAANSPWVELADSARFHREVQRVVNLRPSVIAAAHTPAILGPYVGSALDMTFNLPGQSAPSLPGQAELEAMRTQFIHP